MLSGLWPFCPDPERLPRDPKQRGPTPQQSCPPEGASYAWRWPRPPPAHTAASLTLTPCAGPRPGARAAGPPAAGPRPVRVMREGRLRQDSVGTAGTGGASAGLPGPAYPLLQPLSKQSPRANLWGFWDTIQPSGETTGKACQQINPTKVILSL